MIYINLPRFYEFINQIADILFALVMIHVVIGIVLGIVAYGVYAERRLSAIIQDRLGPNRVGPQGLLQPLADGLKFLFKEDVIPDHVNKVLYCLAPVIILVPALITFAVIPLGDTITIFGRDFNIQIADVNIGILYIFAVSLLGVYGLVLGGWASNNKYSLLGGMRSAAQMISYEISLGLSIVGILMICGTLRLNEIVINQTGYMLGFIPKWNILFQPAAFIVFVTAMLAENNRLPFDFPEAEPELVGGYHTEYNSFKFGLFMMAEYTNMFAGSAIIVTLFFGGWHIPGLASLGLPKVLYSLLTVAAFLVKTIIMLLIIIQIRWTLPRFRYDQLMRLGWKILLPLALINIFLTGAGMYILQI